MSSEPLPQGIYLLVKYHGSKAALHFTEAFTETSSSFFRNDLSTMRFPHPKITNTRLAPDATVIAWWPDTSHSTHLGLCNNLKNSTNAASSGVLGRLSISFLVVREMEAGGKNPIVLASAKLDNIRLPPPQGLPSQAKRPRLEEPSQNLSHFFTPQHPQVPQSHPSVSKNTAVTTSTAQKRTWDGQIIPPKPLGPSGALVPQIAPRPPVPAPQTAAPIQTTHNLPPRPSFGPPPPARIPSIPLKQGTPGAQATSNAAGVPRTQPVALQGVPKAQSASATPWPPAPPAKPRPGSTSTLIGLQIRSPQTPLAPCVPQQPAAIEEQIKNHRSALVRLRTSLPALLGKDKMIVAQLKALGAGNVPAPMKLVDEASLAAKEAELEALRKRVRSTEEMLRTQMNLKARLNETANKLEVEQQARKKFEETVAAAREAEAESKRRLEGMQELLTEEADDLIASARRDAMYYREMCDHATQERDEFARQYERAQEELAVLRHNQNRFEDELNRMGPKLEQREQELKGEKDRRRRYQDRLGSAGRREADLKQRCDAAAKEVASLTLARTIDADNARAARQRDDEALRLREDMSRTQQLVIRQAEGAMHAAQSSEEALKRRLEEVESKLEEVESRLAAELEAERRLRREAEDAIADIRRECREPFVVPSLLDAFVELARLTTAATTPDGLVIAETDRKETAGDTPPTTGRTTGSARGDAAATGKCTNGVHTPCSGGSGPLSPHYSPHSPQPSPPSPPFSLHTPRPNASTSPDVHVDMGSPSSQVKAEPFSPSWR